MRTIEVAEEKKKKKERKSPQKISGSGDPIF